MSRIETIVVVISIALIFPISIFGGIKVRTQQSQYTNEDFEKSKNLQRSSQSNLFSSKSGKINGLVFYASQSGKPTLDQGEGGGNPFASALIELLERRSLTYSELRTELVSMTKKKSHGFQEPDVPKAVLPEVLEIRQFSNKHKLVAFVFVYSDYHNSGVTSLPGVERDLKRVSLALKNAGFEVQTAIDPTSDELENALQTFSLNTTDAEIAIIYTTGHGFEYNSQVYLAPNNYPFEQGSERLPELAVHIPSLTNYMRAKSANLVLFGGCRTYMRGSPTK